MSLLAAALAAAWLGLMTSVSPCPLATNIAAVSFLARRLDTRQRAIAGVLAYATGRAVAYVAVGVLVAWGIAAAPQTSRFLQTVLEPFIGPLLIVVGLVLLGWIPLRLNFGPATETGAKLVGGVQRWQGPLQTVNAWLIVGIGAYLTLSGSLGLI